MLNKCCTHAVLPELLWVRVLCSISPTVIFAKLSFDPILRTKGRENMQSAPWKSENDELLRTHHSLSEMPVARFIVTIR